VKIKDLGNGITLKHKTILLESLAVILFKQFSYSKEEIKHILDAILNPGQKEAKKERSASPKKRWVKEEEMKPLTTKDVMRLINFDNMIVQDYETGGKSSKTSLRLMMDANSGSDESMILKRDNRLLLDMDSSKGLIGKSSKDSKDLGVIGEARIEDEGFADYYPEEAGGGFHEHEMNEEDMKEAAVDFADLFSDQIILEKLLKFRRPMKAKELLIKDKSTTVKFDSSEEIDALCLWLDKLHEEENKEPFKSIVKSSKRKDEF
jgi:hypothetical protein